MKSQHAAERGVLVRRGIGLEYTTLASMVVVWELKGDTRPERTRRATKLIGLAFFALAIYLVAEAAVMLATGHRPGQSPAGIIWITATALVMFALAFAKHPTGQALGNPALISEAKVTVMDGLLAVSILVGLVLNAVLGWWWADTAASLVIVVYGVREGIHALTGGLSVPNWLSLLLAVVTALVMTWVVLLAVLWRSRSVDTTIADSLRLIPDVIRLTRRLAADKTLPRSLRVQLWLLLGYLLSPIDLVPDFIPVIGYADDAIVVLLVLRSVLRVAGDEAITKHWPGTDEHLRTVLRLAGSPRDQSASPP